MKKLTILASVAAMAFAFAGQPAHAQSFSYSNVVMADHSVRTSKLVGLAVVSDKGEKLGTIVDVLVKDKSTEPTVILSVGTGASAKMVAAPLSHISVEKTGVVMAGMTMPMMVAMPAFNWTAGGGG